MAAEKPYVTTPLSPMSRMLCNLHEEAKQYWLLPCWTETNMKKIAALRDEQERSGERRITYTAYVVKAIADGIRDAMRSDPEVNGVVTRFPFRRRVCFKSVDVAVAMEKTVEGREYLFVGIVRDADRKSLEGVASDIKRLQDSDENDPEGFGKEYKLMQKPGWVRRLALFFGRNSPRLIQKYRGTVFFSGIGKYGVGMFPMTNHTLSFNFDEVVERPVARDGQVRIEPMTTLSVVYDHRVLNGAPVARLLARVRARLEGAEFSTE